MNDNESAGCRMSYAERVMYGCALALGTITAKRVAARCKCSISYAYRLGKIAKEHLARIEAAEESDCPLLVLNRGTLDTIVALLTVVCQASVQETQEILELGFGKTMSAGAISETRNRLGVEARGFLEGIALGEIKTGANDEIYACGMPVLTGLDLETLYVYSLAPADSASAETWELQMELLKGQGLNLNASVNDAGSGLMRGIKNAFPEAYIQIDMFHIVYEMGKACNCVTRTIEGELGEYYRLEAVINGPKPHKKTRVAYAKLKEALPAMLEAHGRVEILYGWLKELLDFNGYSEAELEALLGWIACEFMAVVEGCGSGISNVWRIRRSVKQLMSRLPAALSFVRCLRSRLRTESESLGLDPSALSLLYNMRAYSASSVECKSLRRRLDRLLRGTGHTWEELETVLGRVLSESHRASSMVENLNSRIRCAINNGRGLTPAMAALLQLYINSKRARRSCVAERVGTSPLERLTGDGRNILQILGLKTTILAA